ncbi:otoferlin-like isoform X2 [Rhopilema esculentum]|uniref:otoferlin-like isoform X2 n=1 Tax=Rhopilema esculentum TaxID=499914 RepID=UPI0031CEDF76
MADQKRGSIKIREMALRVKIVKVTELDAKADRFMDIVFRGVPHLTKVAKNSCGDVVFDEDFSWPLSSPIVEDEFLELHLYHKSLFFSDKLFAAYKCQISSLIDGQVLELVDNLVDLYNRSIKSEITLEIAYEEPKKQDDHVVHIELLEEDSDVEENKVLVNDFLDVPLGAMKKPTTSHFGSSGTTSSHAEIKSGIASHEGRTEITDCLEGKEAFHPRIRLPKRKSTKFSQWQVQVKIIEGKGLNGMAIDPFVDIAIGDQKKHTTTKPHNNNPTWDEYFVFDFKLPKEQLLDQIISFQVISGRSLVSQGTLIGQFKMDLWTVYEQSGHSFFSKWAVLLTPEPNEIKGYLRVDVSVSGKGEHIKVPQQMKDIDVDKNLLLPPCIQALRTVAQYSVRVFAAQGIPRMENTLMANVKKAITGKIRDLADPYVEVTFAGCKGRTKTVKNCYEPEFNQEIVFWEFLIPMCRRMKIQLRDGDEAIGTHFIDLKDISAMEGGFGRDGFPPSFGPCWIHLYGSSRDYSFFNENNELNEGIGEGISYRGRVLLEIKVSEYEPCETGVVEVKDIKNPGPGVKRMPREKTFQLFSCFYDASMIDRRVGERPVQFEISIGEFGFNNEENFSKDTKSIKSARSEEELNLLLSPNEEESDCFTITKPVKPIDQSKRYCTMDWENKKPCLNLKFKMCDERIRHYQHAMLQKQYDMLEDNLDELDERVKLDLPGTKAVVKTALQELMLGCRVLLKSMDDKMTLEIKNDLDIERLELRRDTVLMIGKEVDEMLRNSSSDKELISEKVDKMRQCFLKKLEEILVEPHHGLPDIFIWMLSGGKRVAYARVPATDVIYSDNDHERGNYCGTPKTLFMRMVGKRGSPDKDWMVHAKINVMMWLGLESEKRNLLRYAPRGFKLANDWVTPFPPPPRTITYTESNQFILRAHIYQARSLFGSDDTGLSDAFARVIYCNKVKETRVVWETRSPTWDQMLKFKNITLWGNADEFCVSPPIVVIEIYDKDKNGETEFIGRSLAMPVVKLANQPYEKPFFPPILQWFPIWHGEEKAGDLLAAFELLQVGDDELSLPYDPEPTSSGTVPIPHEIKPVTKKFRVEVFFWGVREMKRVKYLQVRRPRVDLDCCYKIRQIDIKTGRHQDKYKQSITSSICKNASVNPNFEDPVVVFDVDLPEQRYIPPVTIRVTDCRAFGRHVLAGSYVINSLQKYIQKPDAYIKMVETEQLYTKKCTNTSEPNGDVAKVHILPPVVIASETKQKSNNKTQKKREEAIDWWTRLHVTIRGNGNAIPNGDATNCGKDGGSPAVSKLEIYDCELERVKDFQGFLDTVETFPLNKGKKCSGGDDDDDDVDCKRFSGKFKGCIRVWKIECLPPDYSSPNTFKTTFKDHSLPRYDPVKILVRVYCIRALDLKPADPNGKADPYLVVILGRHKVNDKKNLVSRQLNPEFGRMFEFEGELPFDNLLTIQVKDWDLMSMDDFIGETKIDIENRFYSKHRPRCGLPLSYDQVGCCKWRDSEKPREILAKLCKKEGIPKPVYKDGVCEIGGRKFVASKFYKDERGNPILSDEPAALHALRNFHHVEKGYRLVPEHIETRDLYRQDKPKIKQGSLQMWVDIFPMEGPSPGPPVDITPRKPEEFELRVIVWNTDDIPPADTNILTGIPSSDIYVKGWLEGSIDDIQKTDVHYRSTDGNGMFNWRFVFPFLYHRAEEKFVTKKKASIIGFDEWEEKHCPLLHFEVLDADVFSSDDMIGELTLNITKIPPPMKAAKLCKLEIMECKENVSSLVQSGAMRGWWPIKGYDEKENLCQRGEVELEFELLKKDEASVNPAGRGRDEPQPLAKPNRPADSLNLFMSPLRMLQLLLCSHKKCIIKFFVVCLLIILVALFFYSMPGYTVKKIFGA